VVAACPSCGKEVPGDFPFCPFCGAPLREAPRALGLEERKVVSVLFCDLVGFTAASEQADPEDVRARLRPYHQRVRQQIEHYGGAVEKFVGDAVMAVFGAPVAHEDDAERAVRAGLRILEAIRDLNEAEPGLGLEVRLGINTGEAVVARSARPEHGEAMVAGDVVNTASRIQTVAPVDAVAVSEQTYRATSRLFEYEPLEAVSVKGKAGRLTLWRAMAPRARFRTDTSREYATPLVGRELEKPLLIGTFERAAQQRSVQLVTIVGEPGVGKTRLAAELWVHVDAKPGLVRWRQGRCLPYGTGITFWALGEIVKAEAGILESDSADLATSKLDDTIPNDEPERQWLLQRLLPLVGVEAASPAERQELFTAWRQFLESISASRPSVLIFEDLHWADEALLDFLEYLVEWSQGVPLLVLCTARPELYERRSGWGAGLRNATTINLSPLSDRETADLISYLITTAGVGHEFEREILERAGGNPLFAEEFVRLLAERSRALDQALLPDTVQALIAARLDTLNPERKSLLQDAAVVGKVFWLGALADMGGRDGDEVERMLHELTLKELIRPARATSMAGESEYSFWHLLVRDVVYSQIPRPERARRHRAAATWIERKAGERVEDLAEVLGYHYLQALDLAEATGDTEQAGELRAPARRFLALAGERALGLDTVQAEARLARALELTSPEDPERPELLVRWADAVFQGGRLREAAEALEDALASPRPGGNNETAAQALQLYSRLALRLGDRRHVLLATEAVELLKRRTPGPTLVHAYTQLANAQWIVGAYAESIAAANNARALADRLDLPEPARALGYRGFARAYLGDPDGVAEMERALDLLLERGAGRDAAVLQNNLALARYPFDGPALTLAAFEKGIAFCEPRGLVEPAAYLEANCPGLLLELGRPQEAAERAARLASLAEANEMIHVLVEVRAVELATAVARGRPVDGADVDWLVDTARAISAADISAFALASAAAALAAEAPERARSLLAELEQGAGTHETPYYARQLPAMVRTALSARDLGLADQLVAGLEPRYPLDDHALCAVRAQLAEHEGDHAEAVDLYAEAADRWREFGNVPERAYALLGRGRCLVALGNANAEAPLRDVQELFSSMDYKLALSETEELLERTLTTSA
jgi:class 3 adenylate cyclase/tetratricopeptide (TPR) repeat protein